MGIYFMIFVLAVYFLISLFNIDLIFSSLQFSFLIFKNILPAFILIFILMIIINYYIHPKQVDNLIGKSAGIKRWAFAVIGGIISTGPIYLWYPLLKDLNKRGVSHGFIATFLYNRAIKIPILPLFIFYFGIEYAVVLMIVMILASLVQGFIFEAIEKHIY